MSISGAGLKHVKSLNAILTKAKSDVVHERNTGCVDLIYGLHELLLDPEVAEDALYVSARSGDGLNVHVEDFPYASPNQRLNFEVDQSGEQFKIVFPTDAIRAPRSVYTPFDIEHIMLGLGRHTSKPHQLVHAAKCNDLQTSHRLREKIEFPALYTLGEDAQDDVRTFDINDTGFLRIANGWLIGAWKKDLVIRKLHHEMIGRPFVYTRPADTAFRLWERGRGSTVRGQDAHRELASYIRNNVLPGITEPACSIY